MRTGFLDECVGAQAERFVDILAAVGGGVHNDTEPLPFFGAPNFVKDLKTVANRHIDVQKNDCGNYCRCLFEIVEKQNPVLEQAQLGFGRNFRKGIGEKFPIIRIVINEHHQNII